MAELQNTFSGRLVLPRFVYHGTLTKYLPGLRERLLDRSWWRKTDRDFGAAMYTTISFNQSAKWAQKLEEENIGETGCVLKIRCHPEAFPDFPHCLVFLGETNPDWTRFIVDHRYECDDTGKDPCGSQHPAIVVGQMADNKMDDVRDEYDSQGYAIMGDKYEWFYDRITRDRQQRKLDALELGNQIAICDDGLNEMFKMVSHFTFEEARKEWVEHDENAGTL